MSAKSGIVLSMAIMIVAVNSVLAIHEEIPVSLNERLIRAVKDSHDEEVSTLLRAGANPNTQYSRGTRGEMSVLCLVRNVSIVETLFRYGAMLDTEYKTTYVSDKGHSYIARTPLISAIEKHQ